MDRKTKTIFSILGTVLIPLAAQADQAMSNNQRSDRTQTQPLYVSGESVKTGQLPAGYNASAAYKCMDGQDVFVSADYIYWNWNQDSFKRGELVVTSSTTSGSQEHQYLNAGYASGFQVGLGFNMPGMDDWNLCADYTWYKNSGKLDVDTDALHLFRFLSRTTDTLTYRKGTASFEMKMDFNEFDLLLKRPFYFGKKLTANLIAGLDALWITQNYDLAASGYVGSAASAVTTADTRAVSLKTKAWSLGPKFGLDTNWMLGYGLSILANISASLLYTSYYDLSVNNTFTQLSGTFTVTDSVPHNLNVLRPISKMFLGLGWNMGLCDNSFRLGFSGGYDFGMYWNYDMINFTNTNGNSASGNMYLQGLNLQARFDF